MGYPDRASQKQHKGKPVPGRTQRPGTRSSAMPLCQRQWQCHRHGEQEGPFPIISTPLLLAPHSHWGQTDAAGRGSRCWCHPGWVPSPPVNQAVSRVEGDFGCKQSPCPCRRNVGSNKGAFVQHRAPSQCPRPGPPSPRHRTFPPAFS